uniref:Uncharacterized protein n=1 Tax=Anguilla anguilla TaxID=7936 RepID=A0A0E9UUR2_ANGAN
MGFILLYMYYYGVSLLVRTVLFSH